MQTPDYLTDILNTFPGDVGASRLISSYEHEESRHAYLGALFERLGRIPLGLFKTITSCKHPIASRTYSTRSLAMWTPVDGDVDASKLISSYEHAESRHAYLGAFLERLGRIPLRRAESFLHIRSDHKFMARSARGELAEEEVLVQCRIACFIQGICGVGVSRF